MAGAAEKMPTIQWPSEKNIWENMSNCLKVDYRYEKKVGPWKNIFIDISWGLLYIKGYSSALISI